MKINELKVEGFRSLWDTEIKKFGPVNIIYGDNNSGKSNILAALETAFRVEKLSSLESPVAGFYRSGLSDFTDSFSICDDGTTFKTANIYIRIELEKHDLESLPKFWNFISDNKLVGKAHNVFIGLTFEIEPVFKSNSTKSLKKATINKEILFDVTKPVQDRFFPSISNSITDIEVRQKPVEELFLKLINCFTLIHTDRHISNENLIQAQPQLSSSQFKNWLRNISERRGSDYELFKQIQQYFKEEPFSFGILRPIVEEPIADILVTSDSGRQLSIERLGTGVQQVLFLLSNLLSAKSKFIGLEEFELNLSPRLQNEALSFIRSKVHTIDGFCDQLFLTSHSMHLSKEKTQFYIPHS